MSQRRLDRMRMAIRTLEQVGVKPTGRAVLEQIGSRPDPRTGLNGRDAKLWAEALTREGYVRDDSGHWVLP